MREALGNLIAILAVPLLPIGMGYLILVGSDALFASPAWPIVAAVLPWVFLGGMAAALLVLAGLFLVAVYSVLHIVADVIEK